MPTVHIELEGTHTQTVLDQDIRRAILHTTAKLPGDRLWQVSIRLVDDQAMQSLNRHHRGHDYPTDVLSVPSFAFQEGRPPLDLPPGPILLGTVILNLDAAARQAKEAGHDLLQEVQFLVAHGVRHLIGIHHGDEETESRKTWLKGT